MDLSLRGLACGLVWVFVSGHEGYAQTLKDTLNKKASSTQTGGSGSGTVTGGSVPGSGSAQALAQAQAEAAARAQQTFEKGALTLRNQLAAQAAARAAALSGANNLGQNPNNPLVTLPDVPDGMAVGGLVPDSGLSSLGVANPVSSWIGANTPVQTSSGTPGQVKVTVQQTAQQALLQWDTFNIGKNTNLNFDQSAGGANVNQWVAFNKIKDPSLNPSQILGSLTTSGPVNAQGQATAGGQVYVINQNGIIFGGSSQVNTHALVASSVPINDNLIKLGLLNNPDLQFLFSQDTIQKKAGGTMDAFIPEASLLGNRDGDIVVQSGAQLSSPTTGEKVGGRIALIGANVDNRGTISTPDGQTILAAGRQVAMTAHASSDPSLRGLDVYVGAADQFSGVVTNSGVIDAPRANVTLAGKTVNQNGVINSSTSVSLNGRVDLQANYNAVINPVYDPVINPTVSPYVYKSNGTVTVGNGSLTQILPEVQSTETVVGTQLALQSQVNLEGGAIHMAQDSMLLAPNAKVAISAGERLADNGTYKLVYSNGQVALDEGAVISVAGSQDVNASVAQNIISVQLTGTELADSPLQRDGVLRGATVQVDVGQTGTYNGKTWVGTPLADVSGYVGLVQHSVGELTSAGGSVTINSGGTVSLHAGSHVDVSGGWINYQGAEIQTTQLASGGNIYDISQARPDLVYDGIYDGSLQNSVEWGISNQYINQVGAGSYFQAGYLQAGNGGNLSITAPNMALDGGLHGTTLIGGRQKYTPARIKSTFGNSTVQSAMQLMLGTPEKASLSLTFQKQGIDKDFNPFSPTPPNIVFSKNGKLNPSDTMEMDISPDLFGMGGFGRLTLDNSDGNILLPAGTLLELFPGGALHWSAANITINGEISAPSGDLSFTAYAATPYQAHLNPDPTVPVPPELGSNRGLFLMGAEAVLNTSGLVLDARLVVDGVDPRPMATAGGSVAIGAFDVELGQGSLIDVSGGVEVTVKGKRNYGSGGKIDIKSGQDPKASSLTGGKLKLGSELRGYSGGQGGELGIQASLVQIGGSALQSQIVNVGGENVERLDFGGTLVDPGLFLLLQPDFFSQGGFRGFTISGLGYATGAVDGYIPAVNIAPGTQIKPVAQSYLAMDLPGGGVEMVRTLLPQAQRTAVGLNFQAKGVNAFTSGLVLRGDFVMGSGSVIVTDPFTDSSRGVNISAQTATVLGSVYAPGGAIKISGGNNSSQLYILNADSALATVHIGGSTVLSTAGAPLIYRDALGNRMGKVVNGGSITVSGNVLAESGAVLDVSGGMGTLDLLPQYIGSSTPGPLSPVYTPTTVYSDAGSIILQGGQFLFSDATLMGRAGGPGSLGGSLQVSSGVFRDPANNAEQIIVSLDIKQSGNVIPFSFDPSSSPVAGRTVIDLPYLASSGGHVAVDSFSQGGFDRINLKGVVKFSGTTSISTGRELRVADGGVIFADAEARLAAPYVALGTVFQAPLTLAQQTEMLSVFSFNGPFYFGPTFGAGHLTVEAGLIDIGYLSLQNIGRADLIADNGDIRGNGTLDIAGDLRLRAAQIYPPTAVSFTIAAYDHSGTRGSVTIEGSGHRQIPLSAGGTLNIYASEINQGGGLFAPGGTINLGWDGTGSSPKDYISGAGLVGSGVYKLSSMPVTQSLTLLDGGMTSVSLVDPETGEAITVPYGLNLNGNQWIDPQGTDISTGGVAGKKINLSGLTVDLQSGSDINIGGGGDLLSYRWIPGVGGSTDILASSTSYAILPGYQASYAPYAPFSTSNNFSYENPSTGEKVTDPGYVNSSLQVGDSIYVNGVAGLASGSYTLLPARYALLPGAYLVTPQSTVPNVPSTAVDGSYVVSGYRFNALSPSSSAQQVLGGYELSPASVIRARSEYGVYQANTTLKQLAVANNAVVPRLPVDSGQVVFSATQAMNLHGNVLSRASAGGRGGLVDINSPVDILINGSGVDGAFSGLVLSSVELGSFGAESLLIGGVRSFNSDGTVVVTTTNNLTLDNSGAPLEGSDIILVARRNLTLAPGAQISQTGAQGTAESLVFGKASQSGSGDGVLIRVGNDPDARVVRSGVNVLNTLPTLTVGEGAQVSGLSVTLDSTASTLLNSQAMISGDYLTFNSGKVIVRLDDAVTVPVTNDLLLTRSIFEGFQNSQSLSLLSYGTIDIYGSGEFAVGGELALRAGGIRGFSNGGGVASLTASIISLDNQGGAATPVPSGVPEGTLKLDAETVKFGTGQVLVDRFANLDITASKNILMDGSGGLKTSAAISAATPYITAGKGVSYSLATTGVLTFNPLAGASAAVAGGLGSVLDLEGSRVVVNSKILLPTGTVSVRATGTNATDGVTIGGTIHVGGVARVFNDQTRYTDGGDIRLAAKAGGVTVTSSGSLVVSAEQAAGDAGSISISVPQGSFVLQGSMLGRAGLAGHGGSFSLDVGNFTGVAGMASTLDHGGFTASNDFRVRSGDVTIDGAFKAENFRMSADTGSIVVGAAGVIDASGKTGGSITLAAARSVVLQNGSLLTVEGDDFSSAGKGGNISLEAGSTVNGVAGSTGTSRDSGTGLFNGSVAVVDIQSGATLNLGVKSTYDALGAVDPVKVAQAAGLGHFTGTLHLRAPQTTAQNDVQINRVMGTIKGSPSSIVVEGFRVYQTGSVDAVQGQIYADAATFAGATGSITAGLFGASSAFVTGTAPAAVITPGAEVVSLGGDLTLDADWDLSTFRFGPRNAPGVLTLRAKGNLVFNGALSDGFDPTLQKDGLPLLYLAPLMAANSQLPVNAQSWSYRMAAGADLGAADFHKVKALSELGSTSGSLKLGQQFTNPTPSSDNVTLLTFFEQNFFPQFIRTGSGSIEISAGRDVVLLNPFATIYTAGTQVSDPTRVVASSGSDFDVPNPLEVAQPALGITQFPYWAPQYSMGGGSVTIVAQGDIKHRTPADRAESSLQIPTNWLYRRSYVGADGKFGVADGGDIASTSWWVDFSNFFEGIGTLGGGDVTLLAGGQVENVDAVIATNARMAGKNATTGQAVVPDAANLVELGGGDLVIQAGGDIDGGIYYVERGEGILEAGKTIRTNSTRAPSVAVVTGAVITQPETTWLPTTLFLGKGSFEVSAAGDITLGPVVNAFLAPPGVSNTPAYRTYFSTYAADSAVDVSSLGGDILLREEGTLGASSNSILGLWLGQVSVLSGVTNAASYQSWIRLAETNILPFSTALSLHPAAFRATAFSGDINVTGDLTLSPAARGSLELLAGGAINGLNPVGSNTFYPTLWDSSQIVVSDANPLNIPGITSPLAAQAFPASPGGVELTRSSVLLPLDALFAESGSTLGNQASTRTKLALHDAGILHAGDTEPVRLYALGGDIAGLTLFSPKETRVLASRDITDIGLYLQNVSVGDVSVVSAGRDIVAYNPNSTLLQRASATGNLTVDAFSNLNPAQSGDIQISGPGSLEVLAGRDLVLGSGRNSNLAADIGLGITSIGYSRNPALSGSEGARIIVGAGFGGASDFGASGVDLEGFISRFVSAPGGERYLAELSPALTLDAFNQLSGEKRAIKTLEIFYLVLRDAGRDHNDPTSGGFDNYAAAEAAIAALMGQLQPSGDIDLSSRSIKTTYGGGIQILAPGGGVTLGYDIPSAGQVPPGIVTENGGGISVYSNEDVQVGALRIFTLRGGDEILYSANGDIAAGSASRTVKTAPPTRVLIDTQSADVKSDLSGLATGGGIGVLDTVPGVKPGNVDLIAPNGFVDAGEAGIRSSGNLNIAAVQVLNAGNISAAGASSGTPVATPSVSIGSLGSASSAAAGASNAATDAAKQSQSQATGGSHEELPSLITVEVIGYGGGDGESNEG